jgi:hypothetical protein
VQFGAGRADAATAGSADEDAAMGEAEGISAAGDEGAPIGGASCSRAGVPRDRIARTLSAGATELADADGDADAEDEGTAGAPAAETTTGTTLVDGKATVPTGEDENDSGGSRRA